MPATPPRRAQPRHSAHLLVPQGKENRAPPSASAANVQAAVQTPTKTAPGPEVVRRTLSLVEEEQKGENQRWEFEVKHTFIHFGSPVKTLSVKTPPKSVPSNFAPEHAALAVERLRTPLASPGVSTPWTVHRGASNITAGLARCGTAAPGAQPAAQSQGASSTLLRLSDFLPSPAAGLSLPPPPAMPASNPQAAACDQVVATVPAAWTGYEAGCCDTSAAMPSSWPNFEAVPPLPGSGLGGGLSPHGLICQAPSPFGFDASGSFQPFASHEAPTAPPSVPPPPPPVTMPPPPSAPPVARACLGSTPLTMTYDGTGLQYSTEPPTLQACGSLACSVATYPLLSAPELTTLQVPAASPVSLAEQIVSYHLPPPNSQPAASFSCTLPSPSGFCGTAPSGGSSLSSTVPSAASRLTTVQETQEPGATKRVSICAGHFPEPGAAATLPPPPPPQAPQPLQLPSIPLQPALPPQLQQREAAVMQTSGWHAWVP